MEREKFGSRLGFLLISAGCAIGIGNVWRFPYVVGNNGCLLYTSWKAESASILTYLYHRGLSDGCLLYTSLARRVVQAAAQRFALTGREIARN